MKCICKQVHTVAGVLAPVLALYVLGGRVESSYIESVSLGCGIFPTTVSSGLACLSNDVQCTLLKYFLRLQNCA